MLQTGLVWNKNIRYNHICKGGGIVKVLKILNNNFILVKNAKGQEEIIMGRGLRFKTQVGGCLEEKDVERRFVSGQEESLRITAG